MNWSTKIHACRARRATLAESIGENAIAIIPAAREQIRNNDVHYTFRQDSNFHYLTAYPEPDALAIIAPGRPDGEFLLFNAKRDPHVEQWTGARVGQQGACDDYAADQAYPLDKLDDLMPELMRGRQAVYYPFADRSGISPDIHRWMARMRQAARRGEQAPWQLCDVDELLHEMRLIKSADEIALMKTAAEISSQAHQRVMQACKVGQYEYQLLAEFNYICQQHSCLSHAYDAIVGSGANSCILHYTDNQARLEDGDLCLVDAGAEYQHYAADITRTFPVNGRFSAPQAEIYNIVLEAQLQAIDLIRPGVSWNALQDRVVEVISQGLIDVGLISASLEACLEQGLYRRFYMHNFGHWLGMDVHDVGHYKIEGQWRELLAGMVLTVEPGIYIGQADDIDPRWWNIGIRIEDDVHVTPQGAELLSNVPKTIEDIEALITRS